MRPILFRSSTAFVAMTVMMLASGCGESAPAGPQRYRLTGKVTFDGQPLKFGTITFEPDAAKGNSGPQGMATVRDGIFDTSKAGGAGVVGGPTRIVVDGTSHAIVTEGGEGTVLFSGYAIEKDLSKENGTVDIDVPKEPAKVMAKKR